MHHSWTVIIVALAAKSISALPSSRGGFIIADVIGSPADDLVTRNYALDAPDGKKRDVRQSLFSRFVKASNPSSDFHVPHSNSKYVRRVADGGPIDEIEISENEADDILALAQFRPSMGYHSKPRYSVSLFLIPLVLIPFFGVLP